MFAFDATPVKFVGLLVLFAWCTAWSLFRLTRPQDARARVSAALHLLMSAVMLAMVWTGTWQPLASVVGMPVLIGAFVLATAWFAGWAVRDSGGGWFARWGHAVMFGAMTWHLAAMAVMRAHMGGNAAGTNAGGMHTGATDAAGMGMGGAHAGMDMGGMASWTAEASQPGGVLWVFGLVGVPFMAYLLVAGVLEVRRALVPGAAASGCHGEAPAETASYRASALADAAMNLGMFWMSTGLLVSVAPFMGLLSA